jgi:hypothetical protein
MKLLTLILLLSTGETDRHVTPAWECRAVEMEYERALAVGGYMSRDDGTKVLEIRCEAPSFVDLLSLSSDGPCEADA